MKENLAAYLKDHLAGSVAALELIDDLITGLHDQSLKQFLADLKRDIESDQKVLERLMDCLGADESIGRKAAAWLSEKVARLKFAIGGDHIGGLGLVQALETLALGVRGKELLWRTLATSNWPAPQNMDLGKLEHRAIEQQQRVEEKRLEAARAAFGKEAV